MESQERILAEYEELVKLKRFHMEKAWDPFYWTLQRVRRDLENEYASNISDKVDRWITCTSALYFKYSAGVLYYFLSKMLFRDGYYEAAIAVSRTICEMICYDFLSKEPHPFGSESDVEQKSFRLLLKFIAIPKSISKSDFVENVLKSTTDMQNRNLLKSSYERVGNSYKFKIEKGKEVTTLNKIHEIFEKSGFMEKDVFKANTFSLIQEVYDLGSTYVHVRKSENLPKEDALTCLNSIGLVLAHLYTVNDIVGKTIETGYNEFPDVCKGTSFWPSFYLDPEAAQRGYINAPSIAQFEKMLSLNGKWHGEWQQVNASNVTGTLQFVINDEYLNAILEIHDKKKNYDNITIRLFGSYFHLVIYDESKSESTRKILLKLELEIFNDSTLLGKELDHGGRAFFTKIK